MTAKAPWPPPAKVYFFLTLCMSIVGRQWRCSMSSSLWDLADGRTVCGTLPVSWQRGGKKTVKNVLAIKSSGKGHMSVPSAYGQLKQVTWPLLSLIGWAYKNLFMRGNPDSSVNCVKIHHVNLIKFILWAITILSAKYKVRFQVLCIN